MKINNIEYLISVGRNEQKVDYKIVISYCGVELEGEMKYQLKIRRPKQYHVFYTIAIGYIELKLFESFNKFEFIDYVFNNR